MPSAIMRAAGLLVPSTEMELSEPILTVILYSSMAAATAALGALPFAFGKPVSLTWVGGAYALASGLMLGTGYILMTEALGKSPVLVVVGAGLGVGYTFWTHWYAGIDDLDTTPGASGGAGFGYKIILQHTLHSASEGVAIGVSMVVNLRLGVFMALALAAHNVGEAVALTAVLRARGMSAGESAGLSVASNVTQVLLAIVAFAVVLPPHGLSLVLGFASGALFFLVLTELLPASYQRTGKPSVAFLVSFSAGAVVLLENFFV
ncbi:MAG: ZIP family metal transporter [Acidobacteriota bacterium]